MQLRNGRKGYVLNPQTKNTFRRFFGRMASVADKQPLVVLEVIFTIVEDRSLQRMQIVRSFSSPVINSDTEAYHGLQVGKARTRKHSTLMGSPGPPEITKRISGRPGEKNW